MRARDSDAAHARSAAAPPARARRLWAASGSSRRRAARLRSRKHRLDRRGPRARLRPSNGGGRGRGRAGVAR